MSSRSDMTRTVTMMKKVVIDDGSKQKTTSEESSRQEMRQTSNGITNNNSITEKSSYRSNSANSAASSAGTSTPTSSGTCQSSPPLSRQSTASPTSASRCFNCQADLAGQKFIYKDDSSYCIPCYETVCTHKCEQCKKRIGLDAREVAYKQNFYHDVCFKCGSCAVSLVDRSFASHTDGTIHCIKCFEQEFAPRCVGCSGIVKTGSKYTEFKGMVWHENCFLCANCGTGINNAGFVPRGTDHYCVPCYEQIYGTKCMKCQKTIKGDGVTFKSKPLHRECFTCNACGTGLTSTYFPSKEDENVALCKPCYAEGYAKRCAACRDPIMGGSGYKYVTYESLSWHNECFNCIECKENLLGKGFIQDGESEADIFCSECMKNRL